MAIGSCFARSLASRRTCSRSMAASDSCRRFLRSLIRLQLHSHRVSWRASRSRAPRRPRDTRRPRRGFQGRDGSAPSRAPIVNATCRALTGADYETADVEAIRSSAYSPPKPSSPMALRRTRSWPVGSDPEPGDDRRQRGEHSQCGVKEIGPDRFATQHACHHDVQTEAGGR